MNIIKSYINESISVKRTIQNDIELIEKINHVSQTIIDSFKAGGKLLIAGNGGSAADSQHISAEFVSRFQFDRPGLPCVALTTDTSALTAIGNDYGFDNIFKRQLESIATNKDIFIGITTSGNSKNILKAVEYCKISGIKSIGLTGSNRGKIDDLVDILINVPSKKTAHIQESHIMIGHLLCMIVENKLFKSEL